MFNIKTMIYYYDFIKKQKTKKNNNILTNKDYTLIEFVWLVHVHAYMIWLSVQSAPGHRFNLEIFHLRFILYNRAYGSSVITRFF